MKKINLVLPLVLAVASVASAQSYMLPEGSEWAFTYDGGPDFVDLFGSMNGSSEWDGTGFEDGDGNPGGAASVTDGSTEYLRMVDLGDPRDHGFPGDPGSGRKIRFHTTEDIFGTRPLNFDPDGEDGMTMYFRARLTPGQVLRDLGLTTLPDGGGAPFDWPLEGKGQTDIRFGGSGFVSINDPDAEGFGFTGGTVSFALDYGANSANYDVDGLSMNNTNGITPDGGLSDSGGGGDLNIAELSELTSWQDIWVTIDPSDSLDNATHKVSVWTNGGSDSMEFEVTSGTWNVGGDSFATNLNFGPSATDDYSATDLDFIYVANGLITPDAITGGEDVCGDFDRDGDVDSADRTTQTTNWTGALPPGDPNATKTFEQGDCDADGDIDTADQNGLINNWTGAMNAGNLEDGADADLIYDPATGNVKLDASDTGSKQFISFVFGTGQNDMRPDNLVKSADGSAGPFFDVGTNTDATTFQIGQTDPLNQGAGPVIDLGDVFPAGIASEEALEEYLTLAEYASELGSGGTFDLNVIPEPSSLALALIGMLGLVSRRRRK